MVVSHHSPQGCSRHCLPCLCGLSWVGFALGLGSEARGAVCAWRGWGGMLGVGAEPPGGAPPGTGGEPGEGQLIHLTPEPIDCTARGPCQLWMAPPRGLP